MGIGKNANTCTLVTHARIFRSWGEQFQRWPVQSNAFKIESQAYPTQDHQREEGSKEQSKRGAIDPSSELRHSPHHDSKGLEERKPCLHGRPSCKQPKTHPLRAPDIPDIVSAVVQALPPQTKAISTRPSRQSRQRTTQVALEARSHRSSRVLQDEADEAEESDHEDFGR